MLGKLVKHIIHMFHFISYFVYIYTYISRILAKEILAKKNDHIVVCTSKIVYHAWSTTLLHTKIKSLHTKKSLLPDRRAILGGHRKHSR